MEGSVVGVSEAGAGPTARVLKGPIQLRESFALSKAVSVSFLAPWRMVAGKLWTHVQPCTVYGGGHAKGVHNGAVATGQTRSGDGVEFAGEAVCILLVLGGEVAIAKVVMVQALVVANVGGVEQRQRETWKAAHVYFVGGEPGKSVDEVVVGGLDVVQQRVQVVLLLVDAHGQHHGHGVVDVLDAAIGAGVVRTGVDLVDTKAFRPLFLSCTLLYRATRLCVLSLCDSVLMCYNLVVLFWTDLGYSLSVVD